MCVFVQVPPAVLLSSMSTDTVCERLKQIDGIDTSMLPQYTSTIKKVCLLIKLILLCMLELLNCAEKYVFLILFQILYVLCSYALCSFFPSCSSFCTAFLA